MRGQDDTMRQRVRLASAAAWALEVWVKQGCWEIHKIGMTTKGTMCTFLTLCWREYASNVFQLSSRLVLSCVRLAACAGLYAPTDFYYYISRTLLALYSHLHNTPKVALDAHPHPHSFVHFPTLTVRQWIQPLLSPAQSLLYPVPRHLRPLKERAANPMPCVLLFLMLHSNLA